MLPVKVIADLGALPSPPAEKPSPSRSSISRYPPVVPLKICACSPLSSRSFSAMNSNTAPGLAPDAAIRHAIDCWLPSTRPRGRDLNIIVNNYLNDVHFMCLTRPNQWCSKWAVARISTPTATRDPPSEEGGEISSGATPLSGLISTLPP